MGFLEDHLGVRHSVNDEDILNLIEQFTEWLSCYMEDYEGGADYKEVFLSNINHLLKDGVDE